MRKKKEKGISLWSGGSGEVEGGVSGELASSGNISGGPGEGELGGEGSHLGRHCR